MFCGHCMDEPCSCHMTTMKSKNKEIRELASRVEGLERQVSELKMVLSLVNFVGIGSNISDDKNMCCIKSPGKEGGSR